MGAPPDRDDHGGHVEIPLQVTWRNVEKSAAVEAEIRSRAAKLVEFHDHIVSCRVVVEAPHRHHHKGNLYRLAIDVKVPDRELVVTRDPGEDHAHEDIYVAVRDAFDAMRRQLQDYARNRHGRPGAQAERRAKREPGTEPE
jgi:ribosome-associated translation inhibitor RaiA